MEYFLSTFLIQFTFSILHQFNHQLIRHYLHLLSLHLGILIHHHQFIIRIIVIVNQIQITEIHHQIVGLKTAMLEIIIMVIIVMVIKELRLWSF